MAEQIVHTILNQLPPPLNLFSKQLTTLAAHALHLTSPILSIITRPLTHPSTTGSSSSDGRQHSGLSPELLNSALLVFTIYISLKVLGMASRAVYSTIITTIRMTIISALLVIGVSIYSNGFTTTKNLVIEFLEMVSGGKLEEQLLKFGQSGHTGHSSGGNSEHANYY